MQKRPRSRKRRTWQGSKDYFLLLLFWSNHDLCNESRGQARLTKVKRTNRHFAAKVKAKKFASASTGQVRRQRTCTMMYVYVCHTTRPTRGITRSTTLRLPRNNSSQEPWKRCAVLFLLGGGGLLANTIDGPERPTPFASWTDKDVCQRPCAITFGPNRRCPL